MLGALVSRLLLDPDLLEFTRRLTGVYCGGHDVVDLAVYTWGYILTLLERWCLLGLIGHLQLRLLVVEVLQREVLSETYIVVTLLLGERHWLQSEQSRHL